MIIFNRDTAGKFIIPEDRWFHIANFGEFPGDREIEDGKTVPIVQRINNRAVDKMIANFNAQKADPTFPGLLLDFDHFSHDTAKSSEAGGWIDDLQKRGEQFWAHINLSDSGEAGIRGGRYRGISPVWDGPEVSPGIVEPHELFDAGLTNKPNLRGLVPLSNRAGKSSAANQENKSKMKLTDATIIGALAALGLSPESTDEQVLAALPNATAIFNRGKDYPGLKTKYDDLVTGVANSDLDEFGITVEADREAYRPMLIQNREGTRKLLARGKTEGKEGKPAPIHNRAGKQTPTIVSEEADADADRKKASRISNRASELSAANKNRSWNECFSQARSEIEAQS
ncbi:hypothetical protein BH09VER1_BH09VER1_28480 [soil metagenome]